MNLLYIGAGTDFEILKNTQLNIELYFFVDSQPRSEYGDVDSKCCERPNFIKTIKQKLKAYGYTKVKRYEFRALCTNRKKSSKKYHCDGAIIFRNKNYSKFLYYFYSTTFPNDEDHPIYDFIKKSNVLFVSGHEPESNVIQHMHKPITFIGSDTTHFSSDQSFGLFSHMPYEKNNVSQFYLKKSKTNTLETCSYEDIFQPEKFGF